MTDGSIKALHLPSWNLPNGYYAMRGGAGFLVYHKDDNKTHWEDVDLGGCRRWAKDNPKNM